MDRVGLQNHKSGLRDVDKSKADEIIYNASKNSKYYQNELEKQKKTDERLEEWKQIISSLDLPEVDIPHLTERHMTSLDTSRVIMHCDMDYFYCQCHELEDPSLKDIPFAVGGMDMLSTTNYKAREYGIRAGMPGFIGIQLNKDLKMIPLNFETYKRFSAIFKQVLSEYSDTMQSGGLDEAFIDITDLVEHSPVDQVVHEIRQEVFNQTGLTCSAGVGVNKLIAKIASDSNKPNGQYLVPFDQASVLEFMSTLSIKRLFGIGKVSNYLLQGIGIKVCSDVYKMSNYLNNCMTTKQYHHLIASSFGLGSNQLDEGWERKSISAERTFSKLSNKQEILEKLNEICVELESRISKEELTGNNVSIKLKLSNFKVLTRAKQLSRHVSTTEDLYLYASELLQKEFPLELRLLGVRLSGLQGEIEETILDKFLTTVNEKATNICPLCGMELHGLSVQINKHLDRCLSRES